MVPYQLWSPPNHQESKTTTQILQTEDSMDLEHTSNRWDIFGLFTPENSICHECRQVDWDSVVTETDGWGFTFKAPTIRIMETNRRQLATSSCKICRILSAGIPESRHKTEYGVVARPIPRLDRHSETRSWSCSTALHVCPKDKIGEMDLRGPRRLVVIERDGEDLSPWAIVPRSIDYDWLKCLARSCEKKHTWSCRPSSLGPISGLKVIEVSSRTVVEAPAECRYVALSYVWGKQRDVSLTSYFTRPPLLIRDAISVTIAMGYKYLWIDRYCIPQNDSQEKYRMISQMHQVYANASITIIDASGKDVHSGLPGVSSSTRRPQKCAYIRNKTILELPCGRDELESSKWATRGWTYQEGYFSTRRLIFTPSQVLFLCNHGYAEESVCRLSQRVHPDSNVAGFSHLINTGASYAGQEGIILQVEEYSKRDLTYHIDSLNAFLGVLNFHTYESSRLESPILHVSWGLVARKMRETGDLRVYLNWYHEAPAERRPQFPSWAWTGWGGPLKFGPGGIRLHKRRNESRSLPHLEWELSWESKDHKAVTIWEFAMDSWSSWYTNKLQLHQQPIYPARLKVTCLVVPIRFQVVSLTEGQRNQETEIHFENDMDCMKVKRTGLPNDSVPVLQLWKGVYIAAAAYLDQDLDDQDCVIGLVFAEDWYFKMATGCLLARKLDEGLYERVGAVPFLFHYPRRVVDKRVLSLPQGVFLDETGNVLDRFRVSARQKGSPFDGVGERKTISLV